MMFLSTVSFASVYRGPLQESKSETHFFTSAASQVCALCPRAAAFSTISLDSVMTFCCCPSRGTIRTGTVPLAFKLRKSGLRFSAARTLTVLTVYGMPNSSKASNAFCGLGRGGNPYKVTGIVTGELISRKCDYRLRALLNNENLRLFTATCSHAAGSSYISSCADSADCSLVVNRFCWLQISF